MNIIGREKEKRLLDDYYASKRPEFIAVYGRRRVGKTYLIKEYFKNDFAFHLTGIAREGISHQLNNLNEALFEFGGKDVQPASNWFEGFRQLKKLIQCSDRPGKKVIFIDELPWLDTPKSGFVSALEHFWNSWASSRPDILLIVCGSASSWMINKLINNYGGLHNRLTGQIALMPFTLLECEKYYQDIGVVMDRHKIVESYMIFGGVPYYMSLHRRGFSLPQNIDELCFSQNAPLKLEFNRLYNSLFKHSENHIRVVVILANHKSGMTRKEIAEESGLPNGGGLTTILRELEECAFLRKFRDFTRKKNGYYFQLIDSFSLFHLKFMQDGNDDAHFWSNNYSSSVCNSWRGLAFERVCIGHIEQIKMTLGISGVSTSISSWRSKSDDEDARGAQIDLLLDRKDGIINLCEMKYSGKIFTIDKAYDETLRNRRETFREETATTSSLHQTMVTTFGLKHNAYWGNIQSEVTMDDLFQ